MPISTSTSASIATPRSVLVRVAAASLAAWSLVACQSSRIDATSWQPARSAHDVSAHNVAVEVLHARGIEDELPVDVLRAHLLDGVRQRGYHAVESDAFDSTAACDPSNPSCPCSQMHENYLIRVSARAVSQQLRGLGADALLRLTVTDVDTDTVAQDGVLFVSARLELLDANDPTAAPLWGVRLTRGLALERKSWSDDSARRRAADAFARELDALLPSSSGA